MAVFSCCQTVPTGSYLRPVKRQVSMILDARPNCVLTLFFSILVSNLFRKEHTIIYHIYWLNFSTVTRSNLLLKCLSGNLEYLIFFSLLSIFDQNNVVFKNIVLLSSVNFFHIVRNERGSKARAISRTHLF